jgi:putative oxidoreductase
MARRRVHTCSRGRVGIIFVAHGSLKLSFGHAGVAGYFESLGFPAPVAAAYFIVFLELAGGISLVLGLLTRVFAPALASQMLVALFAAHWANGFFVLPNKLGYEYVLLLGIVLFAIALRGGGPYSLDAKIGKEL